MGATIMRGRSAGQRAVVAEPRSGGRLLCAASFALLGSADASGAIFTGHIEAACVASMMVYMLLFAMVRTTARAHIVFWALAARVRPDSPFGPVCVVPGCGADVGVYDGPHRGEGAPCAHAPLPAPPLAPRVLATDRRMAVRGC